MADVRDFYIKNTDNPTYKDGEIIVQDNIQVIINKMEMLLFTNKGECFSDVSMGCDLEFYLWQTNVSTDYIKSIIQNQFDTYIQELSNFNYTINLQILEGNIQDILIINININDVSANFIFS